RGRACVRCCFFFQAEDGIRDFHVTGVQTCALPIYNPSLASPQTVVHDLVLPAGRCYVVAALAPATADLNLTVLAPNGRAIAHDRSEERRVGKGCSQRWPADHAHKNNTAERQDRSVP